MAAEPPAMGSNNTRSGAGVTARWGTSPSWLRGGTNHAATKPGRYSGEEVIWV
jgi:hypothetical protein